MYDRNTYGGIAYRSETGETNRLRQLTQLLNNKELWGVTSELRRWKSEQGNGVLANGYEQAFVRNLEHLIKIARALELKPPLRLVGGFTGLKKFKLAAPQGYTFGHRELGGKLVEPDILFEQVLEDLDIPAQELLMPFFQQVWEAFGFDERLDTPN